MQDRSQSYDYDGRNDQHELGGARDEGHGDHGQASENEEPATCRMRLAPDRLARERPRRPNTREPVGLDAAEVVADNGKLYQGTNFLQKPFTKMRLASAVGEALSNE